MKQKAYFPNESGVALGGPYDNNVRVKVILWEDNILSFSLETGASFTVTRMTPTQAQCLAEQLLAAASVGQ